MSKVVPKRTAAWTAIVSGALAFGAGSAAAADCQGLAGKNFGDATISAATSVAPPFNVTGQDPPTPVSVNKPFCRVEGVLKPSADSDVKFEVWLPPESAWNGKYQGIGIGGFAGSLIYRSMDRSLEAGYAVSGTDTSHSGGPLDAAWALGHPEKIVDFGWRAIHETAVASKVIIEAYYGKPPVHAYFSGCSDGGREALMEASASHGLRWHYRRRSGELLDEAADQCGLDRTGPCSRPKSCRL
jgi:Tannase and feruloyl esterase